MKWLSIVAGLTLSGGVAGAQTLFMAPGLRLPEDEVTRSGLIGSLRGWLDQKNGPDSLNAYVSRDELPAATVLMDELRSIDRNTRVRDSGSCKCYLTNVVGLDSARWFVQLSYVGHRDNETLVEACCTVLARRMGDKWIISSPLEQNTAGWKKKAIGNCVFHYKQELNGRRAEAFVRRIASYDKRLGAAAGTIDFYCCDNLPEAACLMGEDFRADYNGLAFDELSADFGTRTVVVSGEQRVDGFNSWDTHDWWHGRLHRVVPVATIYRPIDEGMAYLYGGSWRIYSWKDVLSHFKEYAATHPDADWLALYKSGTDYVAAPHNLKISYVINALIVQRLEEEKGFAAVMPLLCCGPKEAGDANYFAAVRKVTGVEEAGFNLYVSELVKDAH
jgi:hypothetical protein